MLEHEPAVAVFEAPQPRQERKAEQVVAQRPIGKDDGGDVTHDQIADLDLIEARRRGAHAAIRRPDFDGEIALRRMDAGRAASLTVSAITEAPVSTMKLIRRPSTRASTRKCPRASRGTIVAREPAAALAAGAAGRAAKAAGPGALPGEWASRRVR